MASSKNQDPKAMTVKSPVCSCGEYKKCRQREATRRYRARVGSEEMRRRNREAYWANPDHARTRARDWRNQNHDVRIERERALRAQRREVLAEGDRRRRAQAPEKVQARTAVNNALKRGRLMRQPCETCGGEPAQAHHDDYSKPLDVRWLCPTHQGEIHRLEAVA